MKKNKAITLLSLISFFLVVLIIATFIRFPAGIKDYNSLLGAVKLDYDLAGGTSYTIALDRTENVDDVDEVVGVLSKRLDMLGYDNYTIKTIKDVDDAVKDYDISIITGYTNSLATDIEAVIAYGTVEMKLGSEANPTDRVLKDSTIISDATFNGELKNGDTTYYPVTITFSNEAYDKIMETLDAGECYLSLELGSTKLLDGSSALSKDYFNKKSITLYPQDESAARREALQLASGGLNYKYSIKSIEEVPATFGENAPLISVIIIASLIFAVIVAFSIMFKGFGLISAITLLAFIFGEVGLLVAVPNITVSLTGVVGIILSTIIVVDGLMLAFNRIKEEFESGKTVKAAVNMGYRRAFMPILNIHVVSLIITLLLFALGGGALKSFAITASIGIAVSFIATEFLTRLLINIFIPLISKPEQFFNFKRKEA